MLYYILKILIEIVPLLIAVSYFTLAERKIMAVIQRRKGPNVVGYLGLLQPFADGLKLFVKETIVPSQSNIFLFIFAPILTFFLSLLCWAVIPITYNGVYADLSIGVLYWLAVSSLGVYGIILAGWSSNSKYAFLGAMRSTAQMVSYEVSISFLLVPIILASKSLNLTTIVLSQIKIYYIIPFFPLFIIFCISALAETNRHPFDLPEAEAELVSGYNVEYSAMGFALFFLGEYANMLLMSSLIVIFFLGGWLPLFSIPLYLSGLFKSIFFSLKLIIFVNFFIIARVILPRYRYDQLMELGWVVFLPLALGYIIFISSILISFNWLS